MDHAEGLEEESISEYLSSSSESEGVDSERRAEEEIEDNSDDVDTNSTVAQEKTSDVMEDFVAPHNSNADNTQGQQDAEYDVDQNRM